MYMMTIGGHRMFCTIPLSMHRETRGITSLENEKRCTRNASPNTPCF